METGLTRCVSPDFILFYFLFLWVLCGVVNGIFLSWFYSPVYATSMYQYLVATKLVDTCIVVVANQPKKPVK